MSPARACVGVFVRLFVRSFHSFIHSLRYSMLVNYLKILLDRFMMLISMPPCIIRRCLIILSTDRQQTRLWHAMVSGNAQASRQMYRPLIFVFFLSIHILSCKTENWGGQIKRILEVFLRNVFRFRTRKFYEFYRVFQVSRPYLGFWPDPKLFIVNYEQNVVKFARKWKKMYWKMQFLYKIIWQN